MAITEDLSAEPKPHGVKNIAYVDDNGRRARGVFVLDHDGAAATDPLLGYNASNIDDDESPYYYGFEKSDGSWYIRKIVVAAGNDVHTFLKGASDLATSWGTRLVNSYDTFSNTFG